MPNKRGGPNKQGGWRIFQNLINGEGKHVPNKRGGWKFPSNLINGEGQIIPNKYRFFSKLIPRKAYNCS